MVLGVVVVVDGSAALGFLLRFESTVMPALVRNFESSMKDKDVHKPKQTIQTTRTMEEQLRILATRSFSQIERQTKEEKRSS